MKLIILIIILAENVFGNSIQHRQNEFRAKMQKCMLSVKKLLDINRQVAMPSDIAHSYNDKYLLANFMTNAMVGSQLNMLVQLGLNSSSSSTSASPLEAVYEWVKSSQVSLHVQIIKSLHYDSAKERRVEISNEEQENSIFGATATTKKKTFTMVTDHYHTYTARVVLQAVRGAGKDPEHDRMELWSTSLTQEVISGHKQADNYWEEHKDVMISWLLEQQDLSTGELTFSIDRSDESSCHTPRRNKQVEEAIAFADSFSSWLNWVSAQVGKINPYDHANNRNFQFVVHGRDLFVPVLPLLEAAALSSSSHSNDTTADGHQSKGEQAMSLLSLFLAEQTHSLSAEINRLSENDIIQSTPTKDNLSLARLLVITSHLQEVMAVYRQGLQYLEDLLHEQVVQAMGRELSAQDFHEYMIFHHRKLFQAAYEPRPLSRSIRRSESHSPEGYVSIRIQHQHGHDDKQQQEPLYTMTRSQRYEAGEALTDHAEDAEKKPESNKTKQVSAITESSQQEISFALSATTSIKLHGDRHLHAAILHSFGSSSPSFELQLVAQANQFSSFVLLLGRMVSDSSFDPQHAMVVSNKDEVTIPLSLELLPTATEFKEAVSSISPEQRRFATSFRAMQLEQTSFAVLVIQIKPQLERVLNLPADSLTKEIALTQRLLSLLRDYHIPSDFLSYDDHGDKEEGNAVSVEVKVERVRRHAANIQKLIDQEKELELLEKKRVDDYEAKARVRQEFPTPTYIPSLQSMSQSTAQPSRQPSSYPSTQPSSQPSRQPSSYPSMQPSGQPSCQPSSCPSNQPTGQSSRFSSEEPKIIPLKSKLPKSTLSSSNCLSDGNIPCGYVLFASGSSSISSSETSTASTVSQQEQTKEEHAPNEDNGDNGNNRPNPSSLLEDGAYTEFAASLNTAFGRFHLDNTMRPTIIRAAPSYWQKISQRSLIQSLKQKQNSLLAADDLQRAKQEAFALLDALTRSGGLAIEHADLHLLISSTHRFDKSLMQTLVEDNVNPIERVEKSAVVMAATLYGASNVTSLLKQGASSLSAINAETLQLLV